MTFQYPVEISRDLIAMTAGFSPHSMEVHGVGLVEKLFDVAYSLTDVLSVSPPPADPFAPAPTDYLNQFLFLLSSLRNGDTRFRPLLMAKIHDILPRLVTPMLQTLPEPSSGMGPGGVDIFDGFGNAGMGVSSLPQQQQQYDAKPYENKQYDVKPYDIKPYDNKQYDVKPRIEDIASPVHAHPQHHQHQQQQQHTQQHSHNTPPQPALLGQEPLPPFQPEHHQQQQQQQQQTQTPAPYQAMHTPLDYAPLTDYGFMNSQRTTASQQQQQGQQQRPGMGVRQGSGVFGHHNQQQGQQHQGQGHQGLGMGQHDVGGGGGGFEGLGLVGVAEHLQYR
jgi:hypothetical protein